MERYQITSTAQGVASGYVLLQMPFAYQGRGNSCEQCHNPGMHRRNIVMISVHKRKIISLSVSHLSSSPI